MSIRPDNSCLHTDTLVKNNSIINGDLDQLNHNMTHAVLPVTIFIGFECFVGFIGNILILIVYYFQYERSNFRYFVLSMAVIDLTSCLTTLPGEIFSQLNWYKYEHDWICKVKSYFNVFTVWASASILLILAFDRYRKICHPLAWQLRQTNALRFCIASIIVSTIVASPVTVLWGKQEYLYVEGVIRYNVSICEKSSQYADDIYPFIYIASVYILPISIMLLVVCTLNILIAKTLFYGMDKLYKGLYKNASESTLQSVISTVSVGYAFPRQINKTKYAKSKVNINSANINIWIESDIKQKSKLTTNRSIESTQSLDVNFTLTSNSESEQSENYSSKYDASIIEKESDVQNAINDVNLNKVPDGSDQSPEIYGRLSVVRNKRLDSPDLRRKRKTFIMLILTTVFILTMLMYVIMISIVADSEGILKTLSNSEKVVFFFFWRLYFINCLVNPILYGFMDPRFRSGLKILFKRSIRQNNKTF